MSKLILIDGNAILHRAYHAIPPLTNKKGEPINAVYGFVSMILNLINNLIPSHIVVAFDEKEKTFRMKEFEGYQAKRPPMDPFLVSQIVKTRDFLKAVKIPYYSKSGYEADDVLATIVSQATKDIKPKTKKEYSVLSLKSSVDEVIIVTGDRDLFQLINGSVKVYVPVKGLKEGKMYDEDEVRKEFDFDPIQMVDYKALVGDSSDNYPGVSGIGPKTARDLIVKYKTVEEIYKNIDKVPEKVRSKLERGRKDAFFFKKLATVSKDIDIDFDIRKCEEWDLGTQKVVDLFREYGFKTLLARIMNYGSRIVGDDKPKLELDTRIKLTRQDVEKLAIKIGEKLKGLQYAIRGTASLVLQGFDMGVDDIDLICDKDSVDGIAKVLKGYEKESIKYSESDKFRSYFGKFVIDEVLVEVAGEFQVKDKNGDWSEKQDASPDEIDVIEIQKQKVNVTKIDLELKTSALMDRWNEFHKIKKQINEKQQGSLF